VGQSAEDGVRSREAVAHLAFSVLGLLSIRFRGMFWFATVVGEAILLIGIVALGGREVSKNKMSLYKHTSLTFFVVELSEVSLRNSGR